MESVDDWGVPQFPFPSPIAWSIQKIFNSIWKYLNQGAGGICRFDEMMQVQNQQGNYSFRYNYFFIFLGKLVLYK